MSTEEILYWNEEDLESEPTSEDSEFDQMETVDEEVIPVLIGNHTSIFNYDLFATLIPDQKYLGTVFGGDQIAYDDFIRNAYLWDEFFEACKYKLFTLADFIHNEYFYKIVEIDKRIKKQQQQKESSNKTAEDELGLLPILADLTSRKRHFIIPLVYITDRVPTQFKKMNLITFGVSDKYPEMIAKAKREIEASKKVMRPVKDILRTFHVYHRNFD
jgi:hypothetical protein